MSLFPLVWRNRVCHILLCTNLVCSVSNRLHLGISWAAMYSYSVIPLLLLPKPAYSFAWPLVLSWERNDYSEELPSRLIQAVPQNKCLSSQFPFKFLCEHSVSVHWWVLWKKNKKTQRKTKRHHSSLPMGSLQLLYLSYTYHPVAVEDGITSRSVNKSTQRTISLPIIISQKGLMPPRTTHILS